MKRISLLLFLMAAGRLLLATTYYVSTSGDDASEGISIGHPLATISKAIDLAGPGDTILVQGGVYFPEKKISISKSGLPGMINRLWAFPGESPVLDFSGLQEGNTDRGITLNARNWHIKGFTIANAGDNGMIIESGHFNIIENCTFRNNGDTGLQISGGSAYNEVVNCDSYFNRDETYENADGFAAKLRIGSGNRFVGCRAWNNADDGWDLYEGEKSVEIHYCMAFRNGYLEDGSPAVPNGDMNGFKLGGNSVAGDHLVTHSLAFHNGAKGFDQNNNTGVITLLNNTAWMNGTHYAKPNYSFPSRQNIFKNNISYQGADEDRLSSGESSHNSWEGFDVTGDDFSSLDLQLASQPRQPDGNLPENGFLQLVPESDMADAGIDVGYPFAGYAPDLGAWDTDETGTRVSHVALIAVRSVQGITLPATNLYPEGTEISIEALPFEGYVFREWQGSVNSTENPLTIRADYNLCLEPLFTEDTSTISVGPGPVSEIGILLYPNPASHMITLSISGSPEGEGALVITDMAGRVCLQRQMKLDGRGIIMHLDISHLSKGIYSAGVYLNGHIGYHKFIR